MARPLAPGAAQRETGPRPVLEVQRAGQWYRQGFALLPMLDRRSRACCASMAGIYHEVLQAIAAAPLRAMQQRTSLTSWQKAGVAARSMAGMAP